MWRVAVVAVVIAVLVPDVVTAQDYGQRLQSIDSQWTLPTATRLLGSSDDDHIRRGSINSWDLSASVGSPVLAAAPGQVSYVDCYGYEQGRSSYHQGYGCAVDVNHGNGIVSQYAHCKQGTFYVKVGDQVTAESLLCQVGTTGQTSWPHVHFTILRNGSPIRIASVFDINQMHYCKFCRATNDPNAPVSGHVGTQQQSTVVQMSVGERLLKAVALILVAVGPGATTLLLASILLIIMVVLWLSPNMVRVGLVASLVAGGCGIGTALLFRPVAIQASGQQFDQSVASGSWEEAYKITIGSEGFKCTVDPVLTMGGVTQSTYNAWLRSKGKPGAHVCHSLTEEQRRSIFYERYYLASGADKLPGKLAITYVDFAFNAGNGAAKAGVQACGSSVECFNDYREQFYRNASLCRLYCAGWLNRLNRIRRITE
jgi:hypothetical protein